MEGVISLLVREKSNTIPFYADGIDLMIAEHRVEDARNEGDILTEIEEGSKAIEIIEKRKGNLQNMIYGQKRFGVLGYPTLIVLSNDLNSENPAVNYASNDIFNYELKPKEFNLGFTGRFLRNNEEFKKYSDVGPRKGCYNIKRGNN